MVLLFHFSVLWNLHSQKDATDTKRESISQSLNKKTKQNPAQKTEPASGATTSLCNKTLPWWDPAVKAGNVRKLYQGRLEIFAFQYSALASRGCLEKGTQGWDKHAMLFASTHSLPPLVYSWLPLPFYYIPFKGSSDTIFFHLYFQTHRAFGNQDLDFEVRSLPGSVPVVKQERAVPFSPVWFPGPYTFVV